MKPEHISDKCPRCGGEIYYYGPEGDIGGPVWETYKCKKCEKLIDDVEVKK